MCLHPCHRARRLQPAPLQTQQQQHKKRAASAQPIKSQRGIRSSNYCLLCGDNFDRVALLDPAVIRGLRADLLIIAGINGNYSQQSPVPEELIQGVAPEGKAKMKQPGVLRAADKVAASQFLGKKRV